MGKDGRKYIEVDPWLIIEKDFNKDNMRVLESLFTISNGYIGTRGFFDETFTGDTHIGSFISDVYEEIEQKPSYKGVPTKTQFLVNNINWLFTKIFANDKELDLNNIQFNSYKRYLDMRKGILYREFVWEINNNSFLKIEFERFISMEIPNICCQKIKLTPINFEGKLEIISGVDFSHNHYTHNEYYWNCIIKQCQDNYKVIGCETKSTKQKVFAKFKNISNKPYTEAIFEQEKNIGNVLTFNIDNKESIEIKKIVMVHSSHSEWDIFLAEAENLSNKFLVNYSFEDYEKMQIDYWEEMWDKVNIEIGGDLGNQQGIRFCIFQMLQNYSGNQNNLSGIGAKGLSGEVYNGNAFWDSEVYCLPFYLFTNPKAAKKLLEFRYITLNKAIERAKELDLEGAFYPIATIDGSESCTLWQHSNLQLQASTGVAYGIRHYHNITNDDEFLYTKGAEMLIYICKMLKSRIQKGQKDNKYGFFGVMGPDEFHMMVNNDYYTNYLGKKTFEFTVEVLNKMEKVMPQNFKELLEKTNTSKEEIFMWNEISNNIALLKDEQTNIFEQHEGYFNLPFIDISKIPENDFPLYKNWSYDKIYRYGMIKQPAVLLAMLLYSNDYTYEEKKVNYEFYDKRCIHESSLSPSIHSILACELNLHQKAYDYFKYATRLDLDNYNRNTEEGLHITSLAAAWLNIVYGFGGMRSDTQPIKFAPIIPENWSYYSFRIKYNETIIKILVDPEYVTIKKFQGTDIDIVVYDKIYNVKENEIKIPVQKRR